MKAQLFQLKHFVAPDERTLQSHEGQTRGGMAWSGRDSVRVDNNDADNNDADDDSLG